MEILLVGFVVWVILQTTFSDTISELNEWIEEKKNKLHLENVKLEREIYGNQDD